MLWTIDQIAAQLYTQDSVIAPYMLQKKEIFAKEPNITQRPWSKSRRRLDIHMSCICSEMMILREWVMANWSLTEKGRYARLVQKNETKFDEFDVFLKQRFQQNLSMMSTRDV